MKKILVFGIIFLTSANSFADAVSDIQRSIDAQYKDKLRQFETDNRLNFIEEEIPEYPQVQTSPQVHNVKKYVKKIDIKYAALSGIYKSFLNKIIKPYENSHLTMKDVGDIQQKIQRYFFDAGYSSTRIYIDANTMPDGILTFVMIDGYIEDAVFKRKSGRKIGKFAQTLQRFSFYPFARGSLLNIKDLDQGLEQINRLATSSSQMEILPGTKNGYSIVEITNNSKTRFSISAGADNGGVKNTGLYKSNFSLSSDNLLMLNDNISFTYSNNIDEGITGGSSGNYFVSISVPMGYLTFMASSFNSKYAAPAGTQIGSYTSDGSTKNNNISLESVIKRGKIYKSSLGAEIALKETVNKISGHILEVSSKKLSVASAFLTSSYSLQNGSAYFKFSYNKGLDSFDAEKNLGVSSAPKAQFYSFILYGQLSRYFHFPFTKIPVVYSGALNAQMSPDILYGSEQITLGGLSSVRGFKDGSVSGDSGGYVRNDLKFTLSNVFKRNGLFNILSDTNINLFIDYGYARHIAYSKDYQAAGSGAGLSYAMKYFNVSFTWARCIYNLSGLEDEGGVLYFSLQGKYYF